MSTPKTAKEARDRIVEALRLDLVGPWAGHPFEREALPGWVRPSNWYLTGFLIPSRSPPEKATDPDEDEDLGLVPEGGGLPEESSEEHRAAKRGRFPSSIGLSFLVGPTTKEVEVAVRWGDYALVEGEDGKTNSVWQRTPREACFTLALNGTTQVLDVPDSGGLQVHVLERRVEAPDLAELLPLGTRAVSIFLSNCRNPDPETPDRAYAFQAEVEVRSEHFVPRPDLRGAMAEDWDEQVADLHYADVPEFAVGHGVSADWEVEDGVCRVVRTSFVPRAEVEKTVSADVPGLETSMEALGHLEDGEAARKALGPLVDRYREWIAAKRAGIQGLSGRRGETAKELLRLAEVAADRIEAGIEVLAKDPDALDAFRVANRAVARAIARRLKMDSPAWRPFQIAFLLLNLPAIADPDNPHRATVDLLFFPTGGGKTEAYFGLAAFAMVLRRLRNPGHQGRDGCGVSVVMRYTLRLLTLDQLARAAGLVCALELEREQAPERYGEWPFEIGLWVGKGGTPNLLGRKGDQRQDTARARVRQFKADPKHKPSPIPIEACPWCGSRFSPESFVLEPEDDAPRNLRIVCSNFECDFASKRSLPIVAVDEPLYRRLPAFLIATVDKFASLPWVGTSGVLLGGADRYDSEGFYGPAEPRRGQSLGRPLLGPDLVIQDEMHLIAGPLGTMVGLYETAIEALATRYGPRPKVVASTATVRRAQDQAQALFARAVTQVFPPAGIDRRDSFFARIVPASAVPGRLYVGVAGPGRSAKVVMRQVWLALMAAAERLYRDAGGEKNPANPLDAYMTVVGYFNSLRELGGARRILEEEVQNTLKGYGTRRRIGEKPGLFADRTGFSEVLELTSRVTTDKVAEARERLGCGFHDAQRRVDCALATNMISVGLDIPRLGLMVVVGPPKTHAEYIQATSRVGRQDDRPGLVVTLYNLHKPRDRSQYERFRHYHETFYRAVEVGSVTPFAARALDRGLAGALVGLARHIAPGITPPDGAQRLASVRATIEPRLLETFRWRVSHQPTADEQEREERVRAIEARIVDLLDSWQKVADDTAQVGGTLCYQKHEAKGGSPLLRDMLDQDFRSEHSRKFRALRSLRDVEPSVTFVVEDLP